MTAPLLIEFLLAALGIAVNPPAVIAAILLVASSRRKASPLRVAGSSDCSWLDRLHGRQRHSWSIRRVMCHCLWSSRGRHHLLGLAGMKWRSHRTAGDKELPGWMSRLYSIGPARLPGGGHVCGGSTPRRSRSTPQGRDNLGASLAVETEWAALVAFVLLASLSVTAPVAFSVFAPRRSKRFSARRALARRQQRGGRSGGPAGSRIDGSVLRRRRLGADHRPA